MLLSCLNVCGSGCFGFPVGWFGGFRCLLFGNVLLGCGLWCGLGVRFVV